MGGLSPGRGAGLGSGACPHPYPCCLPPIPIPWVAISGQTPFLGAVVPGPQIWRV